MGRVDIRSSQRESMIVRHRHEAYIEEQPGVSNRNHMIVGLDGITPLQVKHIELCVRVAVSN